MTFITHFYFNNVPHILFFTLKCYIYPFTTNFLIGNCIFVAHKGSKLWYPFLPSLAFQWLGLQGGIILLQISFVLIASIWFRYLLLGHYNNHVQLPCCKTVWIPAYLCQQSEFQARQNYKDLVPTNKQTKNKTPIIQDIGELMVSYSLWVGRPQITKQRLFFDKVSYRLT